MLNKFLSKLFLLTFTGATLGTSTLAGIKVAANLNTDVAKTERPVVIDTYPVPSPSPSPSPEPEASHVSDSDLPPAAADNLLSSSPSGAPASGACLVTLFGQQYDVAPLRNSHSGGDIFVCNSDMTAIYQAQHGTDLSRMAPYLVGSGGTATGAKVTLRHFSDDSDEDSDRSKETVEKSDQTEEHDAESL